MNNRKRPKVLMLGADRSVHGGVSAVINNYYQAGLDHEIDLHYIGTMVDGSKVRKLLQAIWAYMVFLIRLPGTEIVHVHMAADASYYRKSVFIRTAYFFHKKIMIHEHGGDFQNFYYRKGKKQQDKIRKTLNKADYFIVLSEEWKQFFAPIVEPEKIKIIENGIPVKERKVKNYDNHKVVFLGRLSTTKGIRELLACIPALKARYDDLEVYLGGVWEEEELRLLAQEQESTVHFLGWIDAEKREQLLESCSIFVLPTYFEGQPISLLEAMEAGCAVVVSRVGGIPQIVTDGINGIMIRPKDVTSLTEGLERALESGENRKRLGEAARETILEKYDIRIGIKQLLKLYRE